MSKISLNINQDVYGTSDEIVANDNISKPRTQSEIHIEYITKRKGIFNYLNRTKHVNKKMREYECIFDGCSDLFVRSYTFRHHLLSEHKDASVEYLKILEENNKRHKNRKVHEAYSK